MASINYKQLVEAYKAMPAEEADGKLREAIKDRYVATSDFSITECFTECFGWGALDRCRRRDGLVSQILQEADAVVSAAFSNITGQIIYSKILDAYAAEADQTDSLVTTIPTNLSGEKIPGITNIGDTAQVVPEGNQYPFVGVSEDYIETPQTVKRGMIVPVTREAILFDRTGILLQRCSQVGAALGINKAKRIWECIIDADVIDTARNHRYKWRGTQYDTYVDTPWDNLAASNGLADYTDIDAALQLFVGMTDPHTGEPISITPNTVIVCPSLLMQARRILNATEVRRGTGAAWVADPTDVPEIWTVSPNPDMGPYRIVTSALLAARVAADSQAATTWYIGDPKRAFAYMQNWPVTVTQAPPNSNDEFHRDIVQQYKASERGATATVEPRAMVRSTA